MIKTKRLAYHKIINLIEIENCIGIIGQRYIGKTILLRQLQDLYGDRSIYVDLSEHKNTECLEDIIQPRLQNVKLVLLDEVTKYNQDEVAKLVKDLVGLYGIKCIYTGSNPYMLRKYSDTIGRGIVYELSDITYGEWLCWKNGNNIDNLDDYLMDSIRLSTNELFMEFLNRQTEDELYSRISSTINNIIEEDNSDVYDNRSATELETNIESEDIELFLSYLTLNSLVTVKYNNNRLSQIDKLHNNLNPIRTLHDILDLIKKYIQNESSDKLRELISLAIKSNILLTGTIYGDNNKQLYISSISKLLTVMLNRVSNIKVNEELLVENLLLYYVHFIQPITTGNYRDTNHNEFDIAYKIILQDTLNVAEVKNSTYEELFKRNYQELYLVKAEQLKMNYDLITYSKKEDNSETNIINLLNDFKEYRVIPNHILAIILSTHMINSWIQNRDKSLYNLVLQSLECLQEPNSDNNNNINISTIDF